MMQCSFLPFHHFFKVNFSIFQQIITNIIYMYSFQASELNQAAVFTAHDSLVFFGAAEIFSSWRRFHLNNRNHFVSYSDTLSYSN